MELYFGLGHHKGGVNITSGVNQSKINDSNISMFRGVLELLVCNLDILGKIAMWKVLQHFACKICAKGWLSDYPSLLSKLNLPTLSSRHYVSKLTLLFKFLHNLVNFPSSLPSLQHPSLYSLRFSHPAASLKLNFISTLISLLN